LEYSVISAEPTHTAFGLTQKLELVAPEDHRCFMLLPSTFAEEEMCAALTAAPGAYTLC
jgi:hypothetical protein